MLETLRRLTILLNSLYPVIHGLVGLVDVVNMTHQVFLHHVDDQTNLMEGWSVEIFGA